jgi:Cft2 family RNA processing exonuclease
MEELFQVKKNSIYLPQLDLYLDARKKQVFGFISHAHTDHIAGHNKILCTPETARILSVRLNKPNFEILPLFRKKKIGQGSITLFPAGHILGSAQFYFECAGRSLLYTGDFRTGPSRTVESFIYQSCDILIMETTFGNPKYVFPARKEIEKELISLVRQKLKEGITPVVFAYPLGKAQEALHLLSHARIPVAVHASVLRYVTIYEKLGIKFGNYERFERKQPGDKVLLLPVMFRKNRYMDTLQNKYTIYLSGWGIDAYAPYHFGVDKVLPYSDHADYKELLTFVNRIRPEIVYCTHGFNGFVEVLRQNGFNAKFLEESEQFGLFY